MIMSAELPKCHTQYYSRKSERRDPISNLATYRCGSESHLRLKSEERQILRADRPEIPSRGMQASQCFFFFFFFSYTREPGFWKDNRHQIRKRARFRAKANLAGRVAVETAGRERHE